jgi:hypothetical protein
VPAPHELKEKASQEKNGCIYILGENAREWCPHHTSQEEITFEATVPASPF